MKYTITLVNDYGAFVEVDVDVNIGIEETWQHFLSNSTVKKALNEYPNYQVVDIDPEIEFKTVAGKLYADIDDGLCDPATIPSQDV